MLLWMACEPDKLEIVETNLAHSTTLNLRCGIPDYPRIIGSRGKNVEAWSLLVEMMYAVDGKRGRIIVAKPNGMTTRPDAAGFHRNQNFGKEQFQEILTPLLPYVFPGGEADTLEVHDSINTEITIPFYEGETTDRKVPLEEITSALETVLKSVCKANGLDVVIDIAIIPKNNRWLTGATKLKSCSQNSHS